MQGCYFLTEQHGDTREWRWHHRVVVLVFGSLILTGFQHNSRLFFQAAASWWIFHFTFLVEQTAFAATNAVKYENCYSSSNIIPQPAQADWLMKPDLGNLNCHSVSYAHRQPCGNKEYTFTSDSNPFLLPVTCLDIHILSQILAHKRVWMQLFIIQFIFKMV